MAEEVTSELSGSLYDFVDLFETVKQLVVVVATHVISVDEIMVEIVQL